METAHRRVLAAGRAAEELALRTCLTVEVVEAVVGLNFDVVLERESWPPEAASRGEARTWADWVGCWSEGLLKEVSGVPEISRAEKVGMCWEALVDHGRICSRSVLAC